MNASQLLQHFTARFPRVLDLLRTMCLEPPLPGGRARTPRSGVGTYRVCAAGRSAHAGLDHVGDVNAIAELSCQIIRLQGLTDYSRGITVNTGGVRGGRQG